MRVQERENNNMKMKKTIFSITLLIISIIITSCASPSDINDLGIVMSTGLDYEDGKVIVTNEIMTPISTISGSSDKEKVTYVQSRGDTVFEALRNSTLTFDKKLFLSHNRLIIFGEEFAKRGIGDHINFYLYDTEPRIAANMLVAKGAKAYEVLGINGGISDAPGAYLLSLIENFKHTSKTRSLTMNEYFKYHLERGTPVLGVVEKEEKMEINKKVGQSNLNRLVLNVAGGAVFNSDVLIGYYTGDEMIGFNFLVDEIEGGLVVFETPDELSRSVEYVASKGRFTTLEIKESKTKSDIQITDGSINLNINVILKGAIGEETKGLNLVELNVKNAIEEACSNKVKEYISRTMDKAQNELKLDTFGIDTLFHRKYPEEWKAIAKDWDTIFPEVNYNINVETYILRTGIIDVPSNIKKGED